MPSPVGSPRRSGTPNEPSRSSDDLGDVVGTCRALTVLATAASEGGDLEAAQRLVERQLAVAESCGNLDAQAMALSNLGTAIHLRGDAEGKRDHYLAAIDHYRRGIELHHRLGEGQSAVRSMLNMAQACVRLDRDEEARALIREGLATAVSLDAPWLQHYSVQIEADRRVSRGEIDVGLAYLGLFMHLPSARSLDQNETDRILAHTSLTPEAIEAGMAVGAGWDLEAVIQELLRPGNDG